MPVTLPTAPRWFDTHVHLERYSAAEVAELSTRARAAGVAGMLAVSTSLASSARTVALPAEIAKAVGVHPTRAEAIADDWVEELRRLAAGHGVVAIGEAGFDDNGPDWAIQHRCFALQAALATELGLALILHIDGDEAWKQFLAAEGAVRQTAAGAALFPRRSRPG